ncbi:MAG: MlaD family protein [Planctomycetota bacterium]|jgi:paraquat-inducible protein B
MSSKASATAIGAFVLGAAGLLTGSVVYFGSGQFRAEPTKAVMYFDGSLKGLSMGAPVLFRGVRIGQVSGIIVQYYPDTSDVTIQVLTEFHAENVVRVGGGEKTPEQSLTNLIAKGMRAKLEMQSMLTGMLAISLDFYPDRPAEYQHDGPDDLLEIPTIPSMMEELTRTIESLPIEGIANDLKSVLEGIDELVRSEDLKNAIKHADETLVQFKKLAEDVEAQVQPLSEKISTTLDSAHEAIELVTEKLPGLEEKLGNTLDEFTLVGKNVNKNIDPTIQKFDEIKASLTTALDKATETMDMVETVIDPKGEAYFEVIETIRELRAALRSVRNLAEYLEQHPEAILQGKKAPGE